MLFTANGLISGKEKQNHSSAVSLIIYKYCIYLIQNWLEELRLVMIIIYKKYVLKVGYKELYKLSLKVNLN
jgi:hypothetical protein